MIPWWGWLLIGLAVAAAVVVGSAMRVSSASSRAQEPWER